MAEFNYEFERNRLVDSLVSASIIRSSEVEKAMRIVPREEFIPKNLKSKAYVDAPLPIPMAQTISAPHMVAMMCEYAELKVGDKVLEVGAGSGYHAAVAAELVAPKKAKNPGHVYTTEIFKELVEFASANLSRTSYILSVTVIHCDGSQGLSEYAPFNKIIVTAAAPKAPAPLIEQLEAGGILVIPIGEPHFCQVLRVIRKTPDGKVDAADLFGVAFVPLRGKYGWTY